MEGDEGREGGGGEGRGVGAGATGAEEREEAEYAPWHEGEQWPERGDKRVPSLAPADRGEARRVAGLKRAVWINVTRVRSCVRPRGTGDVWDEAEGCGAAEEEAGAGPVMALFKRWREMENPWANGGDVGVRQLCRGMSEEQAERVAGGWGLEAETHDGTDEQHVVDVGRYKQGEAKGLSFSKEELRCARYAKDGSERVAFAAVSMMEAEALHDYASEEGGALLRAAM